MPREYWVAKYSGILLELNKDKSSFEKNKGMAELICNRIGLIRPYVQEVADFMFEGETRSRLRTEANVYLYDEKAEQDKLKDLWDGRKETFSKAMRKARDPLAAYHITLYFADIRNETSSKSPSRRYLTIELHDEPYGLPIGHVYMKLDRYEVGT